MHEKKHFLSYRKRRHDAKIMCTYAHYVTLGSRCKRTSSSSEDEADTWPERPTRIQSYQLEPAWQDFESTRTSCQQQNCQNRQYGLVIKPFSSPQMIMYWSVFCIAMNGLKCLVWSMFLFSFFPFFQSASWSNMTDPWQNFSEAEFHIFLCTTIEIIIYCFQGCE